MVSLIQHFEADFLWKVSLKILNSGIILKTFIHEDQADLPINNFSVILGQISVFLGEAVLSRG